MVIDYMDLKRDSRDEVGKEFDRESIEKSEGEADREGDEEKGTGTIGTLLECSEIETVEFLTVGAAEFLIVDATEF